MQWSFLPAPLSVCDAVVKVVAECLALSSSEETQELAQQLLHQLFTVSESLHHFNRSHSHTRTHTLTHVCAHYTHTHTHTHTHAHAHARTRTCTRTCTHTHTHSHTHTHTLTLTLTLTHQGNPHYQSQVYKALIGLLPASSPMAQRMAAHTLRLIQVCVLLRSI